MASLQQLNQRLNEAIAHHQAKRYERAEALYRQVAAAAPRHAPVFHLWGELYEQQGRLDDAMRQYAQALRVAPGYLASIIRITIVLTALGRVADAEAHLRRATEQLPRSPEVWNALGYVLKVRGRLTDALACHQKAVELNPQYVDGWCHFGLTLAACGRNHDALKRYERALAIDPRCWMARYGRAQALHRTYRLDEALAEYDWAIKEQPRNLEARSYRLFALENSDRPTREYLFAEHRAYGALLTAGPRALPGYDLSPDKRLRLAILSPDLRSHSCAFFLEPLLQHLDRAGFEVYLYHDHFVEDPVSGRLRQQAAKWRNFVGQSDTYVERAVREDRPDVLIDLSGHVSNTVRLPLFAKRLAPVQITYLGYPDTTGVPNMDFRFTDGIVDPEGEADMFATEQLVRFSSTAWSYQPLSEAPDVAPPTRAPVVTFGCFNTPTKFTDSLFEAWSALLLQVPHSRLLLKGVDLEVGEVRETLVARMAARGIDRTRVELLPRAPTTVDHLRQYSRVDIALDTFPYNGTTTTCEALWMGRPVVTLRGERHAARVGSSLLTAIGRTEWIARTAGEYVGIAAALAGDRDRIERESAALRPAMQCSALLDHSGQSRRFAAAIRECWRACSARAA